jgi:hypothetical protein
MIVDRSFLIGRGRLRLRGARLSGSLVILPYVTVKGRLVTAVTSFCAVISTLLNCVIGDQEVE